MTEPTLPTRIRAIQDELNAIYNELVIIRDDAHHVDLPSIHIAHINQAMDHTYNAWLELNHVPPALEPTLCQTEHIKGQGSGRQGPPPLAPPEEPAND